jgi:hypothetical protein
MPISRLSETAAGEGPLHSRRLTRWFKGRFRPAEIRVVERNDLVDTCSTCLLTPSAAQLLGRLEAELRRSRGDGATWEAISCPACHRTTIVRDHDEGWAFGDGGWSFEPRSKPGSAPARPDRPMEVREGARDAVPEWLTLSEAAYLSGAPVSVLRDLLESGRLPQVSLVGDERIGVLVPAEEVLILERYPATTPSRHADGR